MKFVEALEAVKGGSMVKRQGWSGMAIIFTPPMRATLPEGHHYNDAVEGDEVVLGAHFDVVMPGNVIQPGWQPTANDMVADDWVITEELDGEAPEIKESGDDGS